MESRDLRLVRVRTQTVVSVVLCQFAQCLLNIFDFREGGVLGCDTQIVRVDETTCSIMDGLIVGLLLMQMLKVISMMLEQVAQKKVRTEVTS